MTLVYIVRHALRQSSTKDIPHAQLSLSEDGLRQAAEEVGPALRADIDRHMGGRTPVIDIHASPQLRVCQTIEHGILPALKGLDVTYRKRPSLRDIDQGEFYATTREEREQHWPQQQALYDFLLNDPFNPGGRLFARAAGPTAETLEEALLRVDRFRHAAIKHYDQSRPPPLTERVLVVGTHKLIGNLLAMRAKMESLQWLNDEPLPKAGSIRKFEGPILTMMKDHGYIYEGRGKEKSHTEKLAARSDEELRWIGSLTPSSASTRRR